MDFVTSSLSMLANAPQLTNILGKFLNLLYTTIGNFGWAVVAFALIVKLVLSPVDIWQKAASRKQSKGMAKLQPELAKLQKQYANRPDLLKAKQAELYKKQQVGMLSSCLPSIVTFVLFFVIFAGFNSMVKYQNELVVYNLFQVYEANVGKVSADELNVILAQAYKPEGWLWVKNLFMPDNWSNIIPSFDKFVSSGIGGINAGLPEGISITNPYEVLVGPAMAQYNGTNISKWNGYLILPVLSIVMTLLSTKLTQAVTPMPTGTAQQQKTQQSTMKMMMFTMPIMIGVFSLFYSAAFSIYLFISNAFTTVLNVTYNIITKKKDKAEKDRELSTTYRRSK